MKTLINKTLAYALLLIVVVVSYGKKSQAQESKKRYSITIMDGDTTINGKKLSKADKKEREKLMEEFREMEKEIKIHRKDLDKNLHVYVHPRTQRDIVIRKNRRAPRVWMHNDSAGVFEFNRDSIMVKLHPDSMLKRFNLDSTSRFHGRVFIPREFDAPMPNAIHPRMFMDEDRIILRGPSRKNSQNFNFNNTDKDGFNTRISISASDASAEQIKKISGKETADLTLEDLSFAAQFSTGKITLMFTLPTKGAAVVKLLDNEMKPVFTDNITSGSYTKQVQMPRNGIYYLVVQQNNKYAVKRIIKQ